MRHAIWFFCAILMIAGASPGALARPACDGALADGTEAAALHHRVTEAKVVTVSTAAADLARAKALKAVATTLLTKAGCIGKADAVFRVTITLKEHPSGFGATYDLEDFAIETGHMVFYTTIETPYPPGRGDATLSKAQRAAITANVTEFIRQLNDAAKQNALSFN